MALSVALLVACRPHVHSTLNPVRVVPLWCFQATAIWKTSTGELFSGVGCFAEQKHCEHVRMRAASNMAALIGIREVSTCAMREASVKEDAVQPVQVRGSHVAVTKTY